MLELQKENHVYLKIDANAASKEACVKFADQGADKFTVGKDGSNAFGIYNHAIPEWSFYMLSNGVMSGDFNDTSDVALKENIQTISSGLSIVNTLNPITFDWKDESKGSNSGFIAQEVEEVLPNDVSGEDFDISVEDPSIGKSINVTGIVAHLTKAIQELSAKVEALENE